MSNEFSTLAKWLAENGAVFLQMVDPEGRASSNRKIHSLSELREVIDKVRTPGTALHISKEDRSEYSHQRRSKGEVITLRAYVQYADLLSGANLSTIHRWLREQRELFVQIELPDRLGEGFYHVVDSVPALERAINQVHYPEVEIYIWRNPDRVVPLRMVHSRPDEVMYLALRKSSAERPYC